MHTRRIAPLFTLLGLLGLAACQDLVGDDRQLTSDEIDQIAEALVASSFETTTDAATADGSVADDPSTGIAAATESSTTEFTRTRSCPLGGQLVIAGIRERERDREAGTGSMALDATRTHEACARALRRDGGASIVTLTTDGEIAVHAFRQWLAGEPHGEQTMTLQGQLTWTTDDDRSGTCDIDLSVAFDPETRTRTVTGTFCGREIDRTSSW